MALVMALILLSVMMASALALGKFILDELKMSLNSTNSIGAYYAADSGLEKALYYLNYGIIHSNLGVFNGLKTNSPYSVEGYDGTFSYVEATTVSPVQGGHSYTVYGIATSSPGTLPASVNITDPSGDVSAINWGPNSAVAANDYQYVVNWKIKDCFPSHASNRLEVSNISFENNFTNVENSSVILICNCAYGEGDWCDDSVSQYNIYDTKYYNFSFRPLDARVEQLDFDIKEAGSTIGIKSEAFIDVLGRYHNATYKLQARIPSLNVLSGVFSYIIFSEQPIIKNP